MQMPLDTNHLAKHGCDTTETAEELPKECENEFADVASRFSERNLIEHPWNIPEKNLIDEVSVVSQIWSLLVRTQPCDIWAVYL